MREYNKISLHDCFNNPFSFDCSITALNFPPMPIDDSCRLKKRACYTPDQIPSAISAASGRSVSNLITPYDSPQVILLTSDAPDTEHIIMRDKLGRATEKRGYCSRRHDTIRCYKIQVLLLLVFYSYEGFLLP